MPNGLHVAKLHEGVAAWNEWRADNLNEQPNLAHADFSNADLAGIDLRGAGLFKTNLAGANLVEANLRQARLVETRLDRADLSGASVYGTSVWDVSLEGATQRDLIITPPGQTLVVVDDLEVAQFIYLLLNNQKLRAVIDTISSKLVLILGRFSPARKAVLDTIKRDLRESGYLPVLFDFEGPGNRDLTETVGTLAHLAKFVIADLTDPSCIPHELGTFVPHIKVPVVTLIQRGHHPYAMFPDLLKYAWVSPPIPYDDPTDVSKRVLPASLAHIASATR